MVDWLVGLSPWQQALAGTIFTYGMTALANVDDAILDGRAVDRFVRQVLAAFSDQAEGVNAFLEKRAAQWKNA